MGAIAGAKYSGVIIKLIINILLQIFLMFPPGLFVPLSKKKLKNYTLTQTHAYYSHSKPNSQTN